MKTCYNMHLSVVILVFSALSAAAWDDDDLEVFDVVEEVNQNFYEVLGVKEDATPAEIKSAFKKLTLKLHPDKNNAPDADVQFRNLVSVHNVLKDPGKREKYNEVLKNGLPNWRSAVYYYRHVRKMGLVEGSIILFIIITFGQYCVGWAAYVERRFTAEQVLNSRGKKHMKKSFDTGISEMLDQLPKPSIKDTLPFQIPRMMWWSVMALPRIAVEIQRQRQEQAEEEQRKKRKEAEEGRLRAEREAAAAARNASGEARRRRGFVPPARDHCLLDAADEPATDDVPVVYKPAPPPVSGGLWTDDDLAELVRLVKKYPSGVAERWERVAEAMGRSVPEVTHMAAKLKDNCYRIPGQDQPEPVVEPPKKVKTRKTEEVSGGNWSQSQQRALEAALAKHPKGGAGDRWQKIAAAVPGKTKEECMQRCKYLSELLKKQKQKEEEESQRENGEVVGEDAAQSDE